MHLSVGMLLFYAIQLIRISFFYEYAYILYLLLLICLIATFFMPIISGASRWIIIGSFQFQPAEIGKIILIFVLAKYLSDFHNNLTEWRLLLTTILIAIIPAFIIFRQPDLGTAIIFPAVTYIMLYWSGIRPFYLFLTIDRSVGILIVLNLNVL